MFASRYARGRGRSLCGHWEARRCDDAGAGRRVASMRACQEDDELQRQRATLAYVSDARCMQEVARRFTEVGGYRMGDSLMKPWLTIALPFPSEISWH